MTAGDVKGRITLQSAGWMQAPEVLKFYPEIRAQLDDITKQGWKYLHIDITGTAVAELILEKSKFRIYGRATAVRGTLPNNILELEIGGRMPTIVAIPEVKEFIVNVCSKSFPRAATVDLAKGLVTYLHDPFWKWERGWENDKRRLSDAREVQEIATWLLDVKKYKLIEGLDPARYQELSALFKEMPT